MVVCVCGRGIFYSAINVQNQCYCKIPWSAIHQNYLSWIMYASSILYDCFVHYICDVYKNAHFALLKNIYIILFCGTASAMILVLWNRDVGLWWPQIPDSFKSNILDKWNSNIGRPILIRRPSIRYKINHIVSSVVANSKKNHFNAFSVLTSLANLVY